MLTVQIQLRQVHPFEERCFDCGPRVDFFERLIERFDHQHPRAFAHDEAVAG